MSASRPLRELRHKAAALLISRLKGASEAVGAKKLTVAQISDALGISRQAVYDIKKGKYCPSLALVYTMCNVWEEKFDVGGIVIDKRTLEDTKRAPVREKEKHPNLFEVLAEIDARQFQVIETKPMGRALHITLSLTLPKDTSVA